MTEEPDPDYINFGDFARKELNMQCQYASHYLRGLNGYPDLGKGLRFTNGKTGNYHEICIHKDDALVFKKRMGEYNKKLLKR